jgi:hypothetical protein
MVENINGAFSINNVVAETRCTRTTNSSNMEEVPSKVHDTEKHSSTAFSTRQLDESNKENMGGILQRHQQQHSCAAQNGITTMEQVHSTETTLLTLRTRRWRA